MTGPPGGRPTHFTSPSAFGPISEVRFDVRRPDGRRFDSRRKVSEAQARILVQNGICDEVRSPTGILRYLKMRRLPGVKKFASFLAEADFTTIQSGNLQEHKESRRRGL